MPAIPQIYDMQQDIFRDVTDADIQALLNTATNFAELRSAFQALAERLEELHMEHMKKFDPASFEFYSALNKAEKQGKEEGRTKFWIERRAAKND